MCREDEVCYAEYYSLRANEHSAKKGRTLVEFYDRFCVHQQHCAARGLLPSSSGVGSNHSYYHCLDVGQLDSVVRRTFTNKLKYERLDPKRLINSRFCCCNDCDLCNEMSPTEIQRLFHHQRNQPSALHRGGRRANASSSAEKSTVCSERPTLSKVSFSGSSGSPLPPIYWPHLLLFLCCVFLSHCVQWG